MSILRECLGYGTERVLESQGDQPTHAGVVLRMDVRDVDRMRDGEWATVN